MAEHCDLTATRRDDAPIARCSKLVPDRLLDRNPMFTYARAVCFVAALMRGRMRAMKAGDGAVHVYYRTRSDS